jgi:hypothetical protein
MTTTTRDRQTVSRPPNAKSYYWENPEEWEPGLPLYDPTLSGYGYSRSTRLFVIKQIGPHGGDCTGTDCHSLDDSVWHWDARLPPTVKRGVERYYYGATVGGHGTEFYGAVIGPVPS